MKTYDELLKFYGVEMNKSYKITKAYPGSESAIGEKFSIIKDCNNLVVIWSKTNRWCSITALNLYDYEECKKELLDTKEKEYLKAVIAPFKEKIMYIKKVESDVRATYFLGFFMGNDEVLDDYFSLPRFSIWSNMYKNLFVNTKYTLKDLGLDE